MGRRLSVTVERFDLAQEFVIARGAKTVAVTVVAAIAEDGNSGRTDPAGGGFGEHAVAGRGECVPYARYGESVETTLAAIETMRGAIEGGLTREGLQKAMPAGAARNALDCALWDLEAKMTGIPVSAVVCERPPVPLETAYTISLGTPRDMAVAVWAASGRGLLKIKLGAPEGDVERIAAVHAAARGARLILDANEGWTEDNIGENMAASAAAGAVLIEQPLPAGRDAILSAIPHPVPVCADESLHRTDDLKGLVGRYDFVNVKLDKTGGLTEALTLSREARALGFGIMVGCMVSSSLAMAPAVLLAQLADLVDLDGPLLLKTDRPHGLVYSLATVSPPSGSLWG